MESRVVNKPISITKFIRFSESAFCDLPPPQECNLFSIKAWKSILAQIPVFQVFDIDVINKLLNLSREIKFWVSGFNFMVGCEDVNFIGFYLSRFELYHFFFGLTWKIQSENVQFAFFCNISSLNIEFFKNYKLNQIKNLFCQINFFRFNYKLNI